MKHLRIILCFVLSISLLLLCGGCKDEDPSLPLEQGHLLDYTFHGTWFSKDQQPHDRFSFSLTGSLPADIQPDGLVHEAKISMDFPENFDYSDASEQLVACYGLSCGNASCSITYWFAGSSKHYENYFPVTMNIFFCPQKEYLMIRYDNDPNNFVLASTNSDVDFMEIYTHFQIFIDANRPN